MIVLGIILTLGRALKSERSHHTHTRNGIDETDEARDKRMRALAAQAGKRKADEIKALDRD